jgi:hypothetical protein
MSKRNVTRITGKLGMSTRRTYHIADSQLTIDFGSVLDVPAEVVVSSDDYRLTMSELSDWQSAGLEGLQVLPKPGSTD